jgi:hypothetical protein
MVDTHIISIWETPEVCARLRERWDPVRNIPGAALAPRELPDADHICIQVAFLRRQLHEPFGDPLGFDVSRLYCDPSILDGGFRSAGNGGRY